MYASQKYARAIQPARDKLDAVYCEIRIPMQIAAKMNANGHLPYDQSLIDAAWIKWQKDCDAAWLVYQQTVAQFDHLKEDYTDEQDFSKFGQFVLTIPEKM